MGSNSSNESILRSLRSSLLLQRERLSMYLRILEHQEEQIEQGEVEKLSLYVEMEQEVVRGIQAVQKVIVPLQELYRDVCPEKDREIETLGISMEKLRKDILERNKKNRQLLTERMGVLKEELRLFRHASRNFGSLLNQDAPTLVDITA